MKHKILIATAVVVVAMIFPLTTKFKPATEIVSTTFDSSKVYQFGGQGYFQSTAKVTRISGRDLKLAGHTSQLPDANVEAWINDLNTTISPGYAHTQAKLVSEKMNIPIDEVNHLIEKYTRTHLIGADTVNVRNLNMALMKRREQNL